MFRKAKHGVTAARRDLQRLAPAERNLALDWFEAVEFRIKSFSLPSRLSAAVEFMVLKAVLELNLDDPQAVPASIAVNMGYASRLVIFESVDELDPWVDPQLDELVVRDATGSIDFERYEQDEGQLVGLFRYVGAYGTEQEKFEAIPGCPPAVWSGLASLAATSLHANMESQRKGSIRALPAEHIEGLMRLGYVLRCVDEALDESPQTSN